MTRPALLLLLLLAGCAGGGGDDYLRPGTWQPAGTNDVNLRAMLVDPAHAVRGVAAPNERGQAGSAAVFRLEQDRRRPLPDARASRIGIPVLTPTPTEGANGR